MGIKDLWQAGQVALSANRLADRAFYEQVAEEMQRGVRDEALWLMAYERANGEERGAKVFYIGLRVQSLKDEKTIVDAMQHAVKPDAPQSPNPFAVESPPQENAPSDPDEGIGALSWAIYLLMALVLIFLTIALYEPG